MLLDTPRRYTLTYAHVSILTYGRCHCKYVATVTSLAFVVIVIIVMCLSRDLTASERCLLYCCCCNLSIAPFFFFCLLIINLETSLRVAAAAACSWDFAFYYFFLFSIRRHENSETSRQAHRQPDKWSVQHASCTTTHCVACATQSPLTWFTNVHLHMFVSRVMLFLLFL